MIEGSPLQRVKSCLFTTLWSKKLDAQLAKLRDEGYINLEIRTDYEMKDGEKVITGYSIWGHK